MGELGEVVVIGARGAGEILECGTEEAGAELLVFCEVDSAAGWLIGGGEVGFGEEALLEEKLWGD